MREARGLRARRRWHLRHVTARPLTVGCGRERVGLRGSAAGRANDISLEPAPSRQQGSSRWAAVPSAPEVRVSPSRRRRRLRHFDGCTTASEVAGLPRDARTASGLRLEPAPSQATSSATRCRHRWWGTRDRQGRHAAAHRPCSQRPDAQSAPVRHACPGPCGSMHTAPPSAPSRHAPHRHGVAIEHGSPSAGSATQLPATQALNARQSREVPHTDAFFSRGAQLRPPSASTQVRWP